MHVLTSAINDQPNLPHELNFFFFLSHSFSAKDAAMSIETFYPPEAEMIIEVLEPEEPVDDPGYGSNSDAASTSLDSSVLNFIHENGRRYHRFRDGLYLLPNDDLEQAREHLNHAMFLELFAGTIHFARLQRDVALNVIDLGTGTGAWATACKYNPSKASRTC